MPASVNAMRTCSSAGASIATPSVRETCTASSSPNTFGSAMIVDTTTTPKTSKFFHSG